MRISQLVRATLLGGVVAVTALPAFAQSHDAMLRECAALGRGYFQDFGARTQMAYNGQRVDGTHAVNGRILLEARAADFACSYDASGKRMVEFFADGKARNGFLPKSAPANQAKPGGSQMMRVIGVASNDVLNVRSGPSARHQIIGALANGDKVQSLGCRNESGGRWCHIRMLDEMHGEGWVNARFLSPSKTDR